MCWSKIKLSVFVCMSIVLSSSVFASPPTSVIVSPVDQSVVLKGNILHFVGRGDDLEDGLLTDDKLAWFSDRHGPLGNGSSLDFELSGGIHVITLTVTDNDNETGSTQVTISVTE